MEERQGELERGREQQGRKGGGGGEKETRREGFREGNTCSACTFIGMWNSISMAIGLHGTFSNCT